MPDKSEPMFKFQAMRRDADPAAVDAGMSVVGPVTSPILVEGWVEVRGWEGDADGDDPPLIGDSRST